MEVNDDAAGSAHRIMTREEASRLELEVWARTTFITPEVNRPQAKARGRRRRITREGTPDGNASGSAAMAPTPDSIGVAVGGQNVPQENNGVDETWGGGAQQQQQQATQKQQMQQ